MDNKEKYIIESISRHRESVDTDALWAGLDGAIPQKRKRRGIVWFWFGLALIGILGSFGYVLNSNTPQNVVNSIAHQNDNSDLENNTISTENSQPEIKTETFTLKKEEIEKTNTNESRINNTKSIKKEATQTLTNTINLSRIAKNSIENRDRNGLDNTNIFERAKDENQDLYKRDYTSGPSLFMISDPITEEKGGEIASEIVSRGVELTSLLMKREIYLFGYTRPQISLSAQPKPYVDLTKNTNIKRWSIFAIGGISAVTRSLSTEDPEFIDRINRRNKIEEVLGGWQLESGVGYQLSGAISMTLGLRINQIHERSTFTTEYIIPNVEDGVETIIHNQDGTQTFLTGAIEVLTERSTSEIRNNIFRYYSIPLSIKYRLIESQNYKISLNSGLSYSLSQSYSGYTSFDSGQPAYSLTDDDSSLFTKRDAISYGFGIDFDKSIGHNWDLNFGLGIWNMNSVNSNSNPIKQKYRTYTLTFGISHTL